MKKSLVTITILFIVSCCSIRAQDECCGLGTIMGMVVQTGVSAGYGIQKYNAQGLNNYIDSFNFNHTDLTTKMGRFDEARGYRLGLNIAQVLLKRWVVGLRFQYQWIKDKNNSEAPTVQGKAVREYELDLTQFALGFTLSYSVGKYFDFKMLDLMATSNNINFINRFNDGTFSSEQILKNGNNTFGVNAGAGFTVYLIPPYIGVETTAGYSFLKINSMFFDDGSMMSKEELSVEPMTEFIKTGGFFAFAQLNLAIPF